MNYGISVLKRVCVFNGFQVSLSKNGSANLAYRVIEIQQICLPSDGRKRLNQKLNVSFLLKADWFSGFPRLNGETLFLDQHTAF